MPQGSARASGGRDGFVLLTVLIVLLALLVLTVPYLTTARNADRASAQLAHRTQARLSLDAAGRHARALLSQSHASIDPTPDSDSLDEIEVRARFDPEFLEAQNAGGPSFDLEVTDVSGMIDLETAPPQLLANLWGLGTRLGEAVPANGDELPVVSMQGLDPEGGIVVVGGEWIRYGAKAEEDFTTKLSELTRGLGARALEGGAWETDGPLPPRSHGVGAHVLDQRAFAPLLWRLFDSDGVPRGLDSMEELAGTAAFVVEGKLDASYLHALRESCSVHADAAGAGQWQAGSNLIVPVVAGETLTLRVEDPSWFNPGATVRLRQGDRSELRYVAAVSGNGIILNAVMVGDYDAFDAVLEVQVRRPVNVNTASAVVLAALFENLQIRGRNHRITGTEANELAALTVSSRPFTGFEDWLRRLVLPAAGIEAVEASAEGVAPSLAEWELGEESVIDPEDGLALYINALNANDGRLAFSTMPFAFTSGSVYAMELRSSVSAPDGVGRTAAVRERTELIVPQEELLSLFHRQQDFDEALRLQRRARHFATGPQSTSQFDGGMNPPSRTFPHLGTRDGAVYVPGVSQVVLDEEDQPVRPDHIFADDEPGGWVQLAPSRTVATPLTTGRVMRFDREARSLEGRYLPDEPIVQDPAGNMLGWTSAAESQLLRGLTMGMWIKPEVLSDSVLLDVVGNRQESDRITLSLDGGDLVLRVLDGFGDHPDTVEVEQTEARFSLAADGTPGLPADVWSHVEIDVAGSRPDQLGMRVNGMTHGVRVLGMTRTIAAVSGADSVIPVESTEGFPDIGVARIGNEVVEYGLAGDTLVCLFRETGAQAGFGGRAARTQHAVEDDRTSLALDLAANGVGDDHLAGTLVQVYGYSTQVASNLPAGGSVLASDLGVYRVPIALEVSSEPPTTITSQTSQFPWGDGIDSTFTSFSLRLGQVDGTGGQVPAEELMGGFSADGGYALLAGIRWRDGAGSPPENGQASNGGALGGVELVRYSGWRGTELFIVERAAQGNLNGVDISGGAGDVIGGDARAFVLRWNSAVQFGDDPQAPTADTLLRAQTFVVPVSLPAPGANDLTFLPGTAGQSEFAQITRLDLAELTEWVRYDAIDVANGQLVRADPLAYLNVYNLLVSGLSGDAVNPDPGGAGGGTGTGGMASLPKPGFHRPPAAEPVSQGAADAFWEPTLGVSEISDLGVTQAVSAALHFRGVFGTYSHAHPAGTEILPVFRVASGGLGFGADAGRPGANDSIFLSDADISNPGIVAQVHRAHTPAPMRVIYDWTQDPSGDLLSLPVVGTAPFAQTGYAAGTYVALRAPSPLFLAANPAAGGGAGTGGANNTQSGFATDARLLPRLSKWPSGERPRAAGFVSVGGESVTAVSGAGGGGGSVPSMTVDEIVFGSSPFGIGIGAANPAAASQGAALVLTEALSDGDSDCSVGSDYVRSPGGGFQIGTTSVLTGAGGLPEDAGLLRIGEEIVCYDVRDETSGFVQIAPGGRGLLGSIQHSHAAGDSVHFLHQIPVSVLIADIGPGDSVLPLASLENFPSEGLVLVGTELIHFTRQRSGGLEMPRRSSEPGLADQRGDGIYRGRFGTVPQAHALGTPVILFPYRYPDLWADQAEAPEMAYFGLELAQPGAFWRGLYWEDDPSSLGQCQIGVLQRSNPNTPWDADPSGDDGLRLFYRGDDNGEPLPILQRGDGLEWRVFVRFDPGAFDPINGLSHGWKDTPRLRQLGATYLAPNRVLRSVDR